jgi:MFS superfamily sulfate permease-like transporter
VVLYTAINGVYITMFCATKVLFFLIKSSKLVEINHRNSREQVGQGMVGTKTYSQIPQKAMLLF